MSEHAPTPRHELEEAAEGQDLYRTPGHDLLVEHSQEQAEASGWLPPDVVYDWPSTDTRRRIVDRRQDLYRAMQRLETSLARAGGQADWADQVHDALTNLDASLQRHVSEIEASDGLFAEVVDRAPHLMSAIESLRQEHEAMIEMCQSALEGLWTDRGVAVEDTRHTALELLRQIAAHRQNGSELLFDAYDVDLAAAD